MHKMLRIDQIRLDFQPSKNLIEDVAEEYVDRMTRGEETDPISVCYDGKLYFLKDGFHRLEASQRLKRRRISAEVTKGTLEEMEAEWRQGLEKLKRSLAHDAKRMRRS